MVRTSVRIQLACVLVSGLACSVSQAFQAVDVGQPTGLDPAATFVSNGTADNAGLVKVDVTAPRPAPWPYANITEQEANAMAADDSGNVALLEKITSRNVARTAPETPNWYTYKGAQIVMNLDPNRIAVKLSDAAAQAGNTTATAIAALNAAGYETIENGNTEYREWVLVNLKNPLANAAATEAAIQAIVKAQGSPVVFASPVFENPYMAGGWTVITPDVMGQMRDANQAQNAARGGLQIARAQLGSIPGGVMLHSSAVSGFEVLRQIDALQKDAAFAWAEPDVLATMELDRTVPNDTFFGNQWGLDQSNDYDIDAPEAWDLTTGRSSVSWLVMDVGTQTNHPDLNWSTGRDFTTGVVGGVGDGSPGNACDNHGTAVAGCVSARWNNGLDVAGIAGLSPVSVAKIATLVNNPPTCTNSFAIYQPSYVVNALTWGVGLGCRSSNASFGVGQSNAIDAEYQDAYVNHNMLHFAAAGNNGSGTIGYPSSAPFVISCAAMASNGNRASFSQYGPGLDISAPGQGIYTLDRTGANGYVNGDVVIVDGTSFASPYSAGVATLYYAAHPFASQAEGFVAIALGATDLGVAGYDTDYGYGFVNAYGSIKYPAPADDECGNATVISTNSYSISRDTSWATARVNEPTESCELGGAGNSTSSIYYSFTAPNTGNLSINTNGSNYDTVLSVFNGCGFFFLGTYFPPSVLACDDDSGVGTQSQIDNLHLTKGQTVKIKVAKYGTTPGVTNLVFNLSFVPTAPVNDNCSSGTEMPNTYGTFTETGLDTEYATTQPCEDTDTCGFMGNSNSVWYNFHPTQNGLIQVDTIGSDYDTVIDIFNFCAFSLNNICFRGSSLICDDDSGGNFTSLISDFPVTAGGVYLIKVSNYYTPGPGDLDFHFSFYPAPAPCDPDVNQDGVADQGDVDYLINVIAGGPNPTGIDPDFNQDGVADQGDIDGLINVIAGGPCP
ncbi:MAG: S8 family serine peptidase [Tepidisphaera sp.]|nr:S8 family serine peptidase [Tepidisphaera sp.]